jgi:hypothetical protein
MSRFCVQTNVGQVIDFLNTNQAQVFGKKISFESHHDLGF